MSLPRRAALLGLGLLLAACAGLPSGAPAGSVASVAQGPWSGRFALTVASVPPRAESASFELEGTPQTGRLTLATALGTTLLRASWQAGGATLEGRQGEVRRYPSIAALTADALGTALPVDALFAWLGGQPLAGLPSGATPQGFEQAGWQVDTRERAAGRTVISRAGPPAVTLRVVLD